jgi:hypothetical protein
MAEPNTASIKQDGALSALERQRGKLFRWAIIAGLIASIVTASFSPSLAVLAGGTLVGLGLYAGGVSALMRWFNQQLDD